MATDSEMLDWMEKHEKEWPNQSGFDLWWQWNDDGATDGLDTLREAIAAAMKAEAEGGGDGES